MREKKLFLGILFLVAIVLFTLKFVTQKSFSCNDVFCPFPSDFPCSSGNCFPFPSDFPCSDKESPNCSPMPSLSPKPTATPTSSPSCSPTPSPSEAPNTSPSCSPKSSPELEISPTPSPQVEITPTPTPGGESGGGGGTGGSNNSSGGGESSSSNNQSSGQVSSGQVLAATGNSIQDVGYSLIIFGISTTLSSLYAIKKTKALS